MKLHSVLFASTLAISLANSICTSHAASFTNAATADSFVATGVTGDLSGNNYGAAGALGLAAANLPLGEFQSVLQFDLASARNSFNAQFGPGQWTIQSVTLRLTSSPHNNAIFNEIAAGQFGVSLLQDNSWLEGTGSGGIPTNDGISYNSLLNTYINATADQSLGVFGFPGGSSGANNYSLNLSAGLSLNILNGGKLSLRLFAADNSVSYLFSSRANGSSANRPTLIISAVPEPGSIALCVIGFASLARWRNNRRFGS